MKTSTTRTLCSLAASLMTLAGAAAAADIRVGYTLNGLTLDPGNQRKRETETILRKELYGIPRSGSPTSSSTTPAMPSNSPSTACSPAAAWGMATSSGRSSTRLCWISEIAA